MNDRAKLLGICVLLFWNFVSVNAQLLMNAGDVFTAPYHMYFIQQTPGYSPPGTAEWMTLHISGFDPGEQVLGEALTASGYVAASGFYPACCNITSSLSDGQVRVSVLSGSVQLDSIDVRYFAGEGHFGSVLYGETIVPVPEPSGAVLLIVGLVGGFLLSKRLRKRCG